MIAPAGTGAPRVLPRGVGAGVDLVVLIRASSSWCSRRPAPARRARCRAARPRRRPGGADPPEQLVLAARRRSASPPRWPPLRQERSYASSRDALEAGLIAIAPRGRPAGAAPGVARRPARRS
ncbi:hypothetical protein GIY62_34605 (plasmid) [Burkholderia plantarii]|uniref:hypothetical protein n=1 Tax=Burkholderia plantarii TaxID=41899 RepID=UPI00272B8F86|nr:hypothetical protein [Burkholderia plantarii]WLE64169.1 hypothetical protein GIY62_34605 [Burkholderia plantarii]